jgi:hypothetical protein
MKKYSIISLVMLFVFNAAFSQTPDSVNNKEYFLCAKTGFGYFRIKDVTESPLIYAGSFLPINISYSFKSNKSVQEIEIVYLKNNLKSSITNENYLSTKNICVSFEYSFLRNINLRVLNKSNLYVGASFVNFVSYRVHNYGSEQQENADVFSELAVKSRISKSINQQTVISWDCSLPICAYVMLRRYSVNGFPDKATNTDFNIYDILQTGEFLAINRFVDFQSRLEYQKQIRMRWLFSCSYLFSFYHYYRYKNIFPVNAGINMLEIGVKFKL